MRVRKISSYKYEKHLKAIAMNYNLFHNTSCLGDAHSFQASFKSHKDATEAKFIKHFNDKTVVFNNQIITALLLLRTHGYKHCQTRGFRV